MAEITDVITKLLERTKENKVSWQTTAAENTFLAVIGKTSALVSAFEGMMGTHHFQFRILNERATVIANYETPTDLDTEIRGQLRELHELARRMALGVDSELDELLKALEG